jgi:hypothetical protein
MKNMKNKNMTIVGWGRNRAISFVLSILLVAGLFAAIPPVEVHADPEEVTINGKVDGTDDTLYVDVWRGNNDRRNYEILGEGEIDVSVSAIMPDSMTGVSIGKNPAHLEDPVWVLDMTDANFPDPADLRTPDKYTLTISAIDSTGAKAQMTVPVEVGYEPMVPGETV